jgi:hypothetical protein
MASISEARGGNDKLAPDVDVTSVIRASKMMKLTPAEQVTYKIPVKP